jgi:Kef-type K+ transport system membrane component KefB
VDVATGLGSLFAIVAVAALAPFIVAILPGPKIPEVAVLLMLGVVIGPQVLDIAQVSEPIGLFAAVGLGFLFFVAGFELPPELIRGRLAGRAGLNWLTAVALALLAAGFLHWTGLVRDTAAVAIALTSTALGTLLPILRDAGLADHPLGRAVLANGAVGEFGPIIAISLLLGARGAFTSLAVLIAFGLVALLLAALPSRWGPRFGEVLLRGRETTSQTSLRLIVLLLVGLLAIAGAFGLDVILGAFFAGMITRRNVSPGTDERLEAKIDGLAFGLFVPLFFVVSGMSLDVQAILESPDRLVLFFSLLVICRGLPTLLWFRGWLPRPDVMRLGLYTATGLPIIVAVTAIGVESGLMLPANAAALVGAGVLSVLIFPAAAHVIGAREPGVHQRAAAGVRPGDS